MNICTLAQIAWWVQIRWVVKYELEILEGIIGEIIDIFLSNSPAQPKVIQLRHSILAEQSRIIQVFRQAYLSLAVEDARRFFSFHQMRLTALVDDFHLRISLSALNGLSVSVEFVYDSFDKLQAVIENEFPEFFDFTQKAPTHYSKQVLEQSENDRTKFFQVLGRIDIDGPLKNFLYGAFESHSNNVSFGRLHYLRNLQSEFLNVDYSIYNGVGIKQYLVYTLIKINCNSADFLNYYTVHINDALTSCETLSDRIEQLSYFNKIINQTETLTGSAYEATEPPIKVKLLDWIAHELDYYSRRQILTLSKGGSEVSIKSDFKLIFDISVANLAYLFKILIENNILLNKNAAEVIRFLSRFVKTKKAESISYESFRIKFYNNEGGTKDAVKKILQSLASHIDKT